MNIKQWKSRNLKARRLGVFNMMVTKSFLRLSWTRNATLSQASDEYVPYASVDGWDWKVKSLSLSYQAWIEQRYTDEKISYSVRCDRLRHSKQFLNCKLENLMSETSWFERLQTVILVNTLWINSQRAGRVRLLRTSWEA